MNEANTLADITGEDETVEAEILRKGLTAPRVKLEDLEANIIDREIVTFISSGGKVLRWAVLTTRNGFAVTGKPSAAVSIENDNAELGVRIAVDNAKSELWALMGYDLASRLLEQRAPVPRQDER